MKTPTIEPNKKSTGKEPRKKTKTKDDSLPPKPFTDYLVYFRLERVRLLQSIGCDDVIAGYDPNHHDPLEHPRPTKYENVKLPPYWYSGTIAWELAKDGVKTLAPPRKHRKRENGMPLAELSRAISSSWKNVDREVAAYCNKLSKADAAKYNEAMEKILREAAAEKKEEVESEARTGKEIEVTFTAEDKLAPCFEQSAEAAFGTSRPSGHQVPVFSGSENHVRTPIFHAFGAPFSSNINICMSTSHQPSLVTTYPTSSNYPPVMQMQQQRLQSNFMFSDSFDSSHATGMSTMELKNQYFCAEDAINFNSSNSMNDFFEHHDNAIPNKRRASFVCCENPFDTKSADPNSQIIWNDVDELHLRKRRASFVCCESTSRSKSTHPKNQSDEHCADEPRPMKRRSSFVCVPEWRVEDAMSLILALSPDTDAEPCKPSSLTQETSSSDDADCGGVFLDFDMDTVFD
ncbi:hypothetical protein ACHAXS_004833 [Conticribra weissflogii]